MKKTLSYLKYTKKEAILGPLFKMLEVCFELLVPVIVSLIIDNGIMDGTNANINYIINMCVILLGLAVLGLVSAVTAQFFSAKAAVKLATNVRRDLFKKIENLTFSDLDSIGTSMLINRMTSDINQVQTGINMTLRLLLRSPVVIVGAVIVAFSINSTAGLIFLATIPTLFLIIFVILLISIPLFTKSQNKLDDVVRLSRENLKGVRVLRAFNQQEKEKSKALEGNQNLYKSQLFVGRVALLTNPLTYVLINIFIIAVIYTGALKVETGILTQGNVIALYSLCGQILVEMVKFANLIITISKAIASANRVEKVLEIDSKLNRSEDAAIKGNNSFIEFVNVSMNYPKSSKNSIDNISFSVNKGETIGIIGGTGSGKTTLINLLNHFYDINNGEILINGKNITSMKDDELRSIIALVPQKEKLFRGTIADNLRWGNEEATEEDLLEAIKIAQAEDVISKKDDGLNEFVEADGKNFSGGQRQRLCIARALVKKSEILILDDSSSALDYATDAKLRKSLKELKYNPTIFIISQRTASLMHCDKILVLDQGKLINVGNHDYLINNCEVYKEIYDSQFKKGDE